MMTDNRAHIPLGDAPIPISDFSPLDCFGSKPRLLFCYFQIGKGEDMEPPLRLEMEKSVKDAITEVWVRPPRCKYPVVGLPWHIIPYPDCEITRQQIGNVGAHIQLGELWATKTVALKFTVLRPALFMVFILDGSLTFRNRYGRIVSRAKARTFYMTYNYPLSFTFTVAKGKHAIMVVAIDGDWILRSRSQLPELHGMLDSWQKEKKEEIVLPHLPLVHQVKSLLLQVRNEIVDSLDDGIRVLIHLKACIMTYHSMLAAKRRATRREKTGQVWAIRRYVYRHHRDREKCTASMIAAGTGLPVWRVHELIKEHFGTKPYGYLLKIRMQRAKHLLKNTGNKVYEVALEVGYSDASSFIHAFRKYHGTPPKGLA
ncbi:helix-turn-helix transcriptional regulator [Parapedobacter koreensis]|uniref:AraC-type DNA-binding protein n=1 Tax=Parapedobacter koreensis TaxID=332977 RepID=A0A1H7P622_9SPHI|nr:AraC family transcriptional regulator [Parapedobacter koreensis]SEL31243.1 AraC-type DNA-binding protein [Parapedobacter koreensis]